MSKQEYVKRYIFFFIGLYIISFGIALSTKADLGVTPISSIPYVLSVALPLTMGQFTMITQACYIVIQVFLLRKNFKIIDCLQIIIVIIFGYFVDFSLFLLSWVQPGNYAMQWVACIISMFIIAFGLNIEIRASVLMVASDALLATISDVFHIEFGKVKVAFDCIQVAITLIIGGAMLHHIEGIREGTIAAAIFVGIISKFYNKKLDKFYQRLGLIKISKVKDA